MFKVKKLDLDEYKKLYVKERILDGKYKILPNDISSSNVFKISCFGSLDKEGYEHGFLYLKEGSKIYEHFHDKDIEFYRFVSGDENIKNSVCLLGEKHEIREVCCDTIIETFKVNRNIIGQEYPTSLLNEYLVKQGKAYLWRIDKLLVKLASDENDFCWKDLDILSFEYQISIEELNIFKDVYFYKKDYLPFNFVELEPFDAGCEVREIPYQIENVWPYHFESLLVNKSNSFDSNINDIRNRQTKSLIKAKDIFLN